MSPELFKLFVRDFSFSLNDTMNYPELSDTVVNHLLWADDLALLALDEISLQENLDILNQYCKKWGLEVNLKKTKCMRFGQSKPSVTHKFTIGADEIEEVDEYCYLGVIFHRNGSFKPASNELRKKALRGLYGLKRVIVKSFISFHALIKLFDSLVKPILLYSCQVITPHLLTTRKLLLDDTNNEKYFKTISSDIYEQFHIKFLKWCLGVHRKSSNIGVWGESGRYPLIFHALKLSAD